jgi:hypothetical protein
VGAPVGPTGCTATADDPRPWTIGLSYGFSDTRLVFIGHGRFRVRQWASAASFVAVLKNGSVLGASVGALMGGRIEQPDEQWTIEPGVVWSLTAGRRFFGQRPAIPFLLVIGTFSGSSTRTRQLSTSETTPLHAFDGKLDLSVGWTLGEAFSPYLAVRGFGGPALWRIDGEQALGGDLYHVSLALGFNLSLANRVALYFDGAFLGLRSLGGGVSVRF